MKNRFPQLAGVCDALRIEYPEALPIARHAAELKELWSKHQLIVVAGDTGSGKTTQLPKIALELGCGRRGRIGCTQPRRLAASSMAGRVAAELGCKPGEGVGYQVRFDNRTSEKSAIKFMTDGILLTETIHDRLLENYDALIIDEAHERTLNIDFLLGYIKGILLRRPDLKVAISSATLDMEAFSKFFDDAPAFAVEGRTFPVEDHFIVPEADEELNELVDRGVQFAGELDPRGDILVFLPGEREIREAADLLNGRELPDTEVLMLFGRLAAAEAQKVFSPGRRRRIILATNVAETSLTIPRIRFVIDSGLARVKRYNPRTQIEELHIEFISQASARQRRGRCGRVADGVCIHLYSEDDLERSAPYTDPEIKRTALAGVILQMAALKLPPITRFEFINPPPAPAVREGLRTLEDLRAIEPSGRLTREGQKLAAIPLDPQLGKMLSAAEPKRILPELTVIVSYLSIQEPLERPAEKKQAADEAHAGFRHPKSDFLGIIELWNQAFTASGSNRQLRNFCKSNFLNFSRMREWRNLVNDLAECTRRLKFSRCETPGVIESPPYDLIHQAILSGIPRHIARYLPEERCYLGVGGKKFLIFPGSGLAKRRPQPGWLLSFALVETSKVFGRTAAEIKPEYLELAAPHLCSKIYDNPFYDDLSGFVYARERLTFGGLLIHPGRRRHYAASHPAEAREIFIREALVQGRLDLPGTWVEMHQATLEELRIFEEKLRRPGTVLDPEAVAQYYLRVLPPQINSAKSLKELCLKSPGEDLSVPFDEAMQMQFDSWQPSDYPDTLTFSGVKFNLRYAFDPGEPHDGVTLLCREEQFNLLPDWALDYIVPGFLPELAEHILRRLPKDQRRIFNPVAATARNFCDAIKKREIFAEQPLCDALAEYLQKTFGETVSPAALRRDDLPGYLRMKLGECDEQGKVVRLLEELPRELHHGSRLSRCVPAAQRYLQKQGASFPLDGSPMPASVPLGSSDGKLAYPALTRDGDGRVVQSLFLNSAEAAMHHAAGVAELFKLRCPDQIKFLRRMVKPSNAIKLSWLIGYNDFADDCVDAAVRAALGGELGDIRSQGEFEKRAEHARAELGGALDEICSTLEELCRQYEKLMREISGNKAKGSPGKNDQQEHVEFLFRPGFVKSRAVFGSYARFLKAAQLRAERARANPGRDDTKLEQLEDFPQKLAAAVNGVEEITRHPALEDFWLLLEECRIAAFTPEIATLLRSPLRRLPEAWENLRI